MARYLSEESRRKIGLANKGKKRSAETCAKISASHKGRKPSPEAIAKGLATRLAKKSDTKICKKCGLVKPNDAFYYGRKKCKACVLEERKTPEAVTRRREQRNKPEYREKQRKYNVENGYQKEYRSKHKAERKEYEKTEQYKTWLCEYRKSRWKNDVNFRLIHSQRTRIGRVMGAVRNGRKVASTRDLIGCPLDFLKAHIERQFTVGMTWDNYGRGNGKWSIDHIIPCDLWDLTREDQQKQCFHYTNLQPMWHPENCGKKNRLPGE